jgi:hypothetical protein
LPAKGRFCELATLWQSALHSNSLEVEYTVVNMGLFRHRRPFAVLGTLLLAFAWLGSTMLWSRIEAWPGMIDLTPFTSTASRVFRGVVVDISVMQTQTLPSAAIARLKVERWYRGDSGREALVRYLSCAMGFVVLAAATAAPK